LMKNLSMKCASFRKIWSNGFQFTPEKIACQCDVCGLFWQMAIGLRASDTL
jgi:hypothetical protein